MANRVLSALAACAALGAAVPAEAAFMKAKFQGWITNGVNATGEFGLPAGASLRDRRVVVVFEYDLTQPGIEITRDYTPGGPLFSRAIGGTGYGSAAPSPIVGARIKINGVTERVRTDFHGVAYGGEISRGFSAEVADDGAAPPHTQVSAVASGQLGLDPFPRNLTAEVPLTDLAALGMFSPGWFWLRDGPCSGDGCVGERDVSAEIWFDTMRISAVPLPPAFLLLAAGLGVLALAGRRRAAG